MLCFFILLLGCEKKTTIPQTLNILIPSESNSLDPNFTNETFAAIILDQMYEGLLTVDENGTLIPAAAESYEVSDQNTTFTFKLRENLKWSDGKKVTAMDYRDTFLRIIQPDVSAESASLIEPYILNVREYMNGEVEESEVGIYALDDQTLVIKTRIPTPFLPDILSHSIFYPVRLDIISKFGSGWDKEVGAVVTNGPFVLSGYEKNGYFRVSKNPHYWNHEQIKLDEITFTIRKKEMDIIDMYNNKIIDGIYQVSENELKSVTDHDVVVNSEMLPSTVFIVFNHEKELMSIKELRKALSLSIDREAVVNEILLGAGIPTQYLVPIVYHISGEVYRDYIELDEGLQVEAAQKLIKTLIEDNLYHDEPIRLFYLENNELNNVVDYLVRGYEEHLGIQIDPIGMTWGNLYDIAKNGDYDMILMGWTADYPHPMTFLSIFEEGSFYSQITRWTDEAYEKKIDDFLMNTNEAEALKALRAIEDMILTENHIIPIYYKKEITIMRSNVKGWYKYSTDIYLHKTWIDE